ncbi:hypothetical protein ACFQ07_01255, partial [Actinomadura adrarensis]
EEVGLEAAGEDDDAGSAVDLEKGAATAVQDDKNDEDDEDDEDNEDSEAEAAAAGKRRKRRLTRPALGVKSITLIAVNLVLVGALGWLVTEARALEAEEKAIAQVTFQAKQAAEDLSSYDYRTIDADLKRATDHTTGNFRNEFSGMTGSVKPSATSRQAVVEGTAVRTSVESVESGGRKAIVLVYLNQTSAVGSTGARTPSQYTVRMVMQKVGDRWMVSQLNML